jgi:hypothetical protein
LHAIFRSRQNKQAIAGLRRAFRFLDGNFNTPCPALGFGANDASGSACDELVELVLAKCILNVGVPDDENDEESGPGIARDGGGVCRYHHEVSYTGRGM